MTKRAVVLGGGGARGPYQIGVWQALRELGVDFHIVTGSSVGALNGALMVQGDFPLAKELWESLTLQDVIAKIPGAPITQDHRQWLAFLRRVVAEGGMDISPLENTIRRAVSEDVVRRSPVEYGLITSRYPTLQPVKLRKEEIPHGALVDYMLASSSWFPFFQRRTIEGVEYIDGAYADNLPAQLAVSCGAEEIIAIDLQGAGIVHSFRQDIPVVYIRCHWSLGDMMAFDGEHSRRSIRLGHLDGLRAYHRLEGCAYAFPLGETRNNAYALRSSLLGISRRTGVNLFRNYQWLPRLQDMLRYRSIDQRFLRRTAGACTLGNAITTAGEMAGELLQIPPDQIYTMKAFNRLLLVQAIQLRRSFPLPDDGLSPGKSRRSRLVLGRLYRMLRDGYIRGRVTDSFWRLAALSPVEFVAANYLLALELEQKWD